jgi:hypothetical protein
VTAAAGIFSTGGNLPLLEAPVKTSIVGGGMVLRPSKNDPDALTVGVDLLGLVVAKSRSDWGLEPWRGCGYGTTVMGVGLLRWTSTVVMPPLLALQVVAQSPGLVALLGQQWPWPVRRLALLGVGY